MAVPSRLGAMLDNSKFFTEFWPRVAVGVTRSRPNHEDAQILPLLRRLRMARGARVLDVPCGFGRHAVLLARRGYRVTGVDIGREVLAAGRRAAARAGVDLDFQRGDMRKLRFRGEFDLVLNLFTSFGYFGDEGDAEVLRGFYRALRPGGWAALQMINRDWIIRNYRPHGRSKLPGGIQLVETAAIDWTTSVGTTKWVAQRGRAKWQGVTKLRFYSPHELVRMMYAAGFASVGVFGSFSGEAISFNHQWQLILGQRH